MSDDMKWDEFCFRYTATNEERPNFFTSSSWVEWTLSEGQLIAVLQCGTVHTGVNTPNVSQADSMQQTGSELGQTSNSTSRAHLQDSGWIVTWFYTVGCVILILYIIILRANTARLCSGQATLFLSRKQSHWSLLVSIPRTPNFGLKDSHSCSCVLLYNAVIWIWNIPHKIIYF